MRLSHISPLKVREYLQTNDMILIPLGSLENHGHHMPLGTDTLIPEKIIELLEERIVPEELMIAPALPYGSTDYLESYPGSISLGDELLKKVLERICLALYEGGFRKFIILNGHGGNTVPIDSVSLTLHKKGACCLCLNWWTMAGELNPAWKGGHGGGEETAAILAVDPDLVDQDHIHEGQQLINDYGEALPTSGFQTLSFQGATIRAARPTASHSGNGWVGPDAPDTATRAWGEAMLSAMADYIRELLPLVKALPPFEF